MEEKEEQKELDNITGANTEESRVFIKPEPVQEDELASIHWPSEDIGCQFSKGQVEVPGEYFFENDHLALLEEGGDDLQSLLRTLAVLEAQKVQAVQDHEKLLRARIKVRETPLALVAALKKGEGLDLPCPQVVATIPRINVSRYNAQESNRGASKRTVKVKSRYGGETKPVRKRNATESEGVGKTDEGEFMVRGRKFQTHKPITFNQPWTKEEQKRLEELLEVFPTEETEMERWKKIAGEMGNRTAVQVQSRVQKYFLKLHRAGLPIPGRLPPQRNKNRYFRQGKARRGGTILKGSSTFLASVVPEVTMTDEFEVKEGRLTDIEAGSSSSSEEEGMEELLPLRDNPVVKESAEYRELYWLLKVRREKERELARGSVEHTGHSCGRCGMRPILGTRWQCRSCSQVSLCNDCVPRDWSFGSHTWKHRLRPVREVKEEEELKDEDYM